MLNTVENTPPRTDTPTPQDDASRQSNETALAQFYLNSLLETSKLINSTQELEFILSHILRTVMGKVLLTKACVITSSFNGLLQEIYRLEAARGFGDAPKEFYDFERFKEHYRIQTVVPIISPNRMIGFLALGPKLNQQPLSAQEESFLGSIASLAASAIESATAVEELRSLNRSLDQSLQKLKTLFDLAKEYNLSTSRGDILRLLVRSVTGQMLIRSYAVCFRKDDGKIEAEVLKGVDAKGLWQSDLKTLFETSAPIRLTESGTRYLYRAGFRLSVPMRSNEQTVGLFLCGERYTSTDFSDSDLDFISLAASQAANALEQARLFQETLEKRAFEKELEVAREIQTALLPSRLPTPAGFQIAAMNISTLHVGGDYYDVMQLDKEHLFLAIADVTGKGIPASLLMSNLQASIKAYMLAFEPKRFDLAEMVGNINTIMYENTPADKFITFFGAILNLKTRRLISVNAGHNPPYIVRKNSSLETLTKGGIILGVVPTAQMPYLTESTTLHEGDTLFLFTDGITEAMNQQREGFDEARLESILKVYADRSADETLNAVISAVKAFQPNGEQYDDITAVCLKVKS